MSTELPASRYQKVDPGSEYVLLGPEAMILEGDQYYNIVYKTWHASGIYAKGHRVTVDTVLRRTDFASSEVVAFRRRKLTWEMLPENYRRLAEADIRHKLFLGYLRIYHQIVPPPEATTSVEAFKTFLRGVHNG